ncbi:MAG: hypothetical protein ACRC4T_18060 [Cetobacterium sp.]
MGKITFKNIIDEIENNNSVYNDEIKKIDKVQKQITDVGMFRFSELEAQNKAIEKMFNEFNMDVNSNSYIFKNSDNDPKVKTLEFLSPIQIKNAILFVKDFIFNSPVRFKTIFHTIDNSFIELHMLPYDFRADYIEEIKFMNYQDKSLFKAMNNEKFEYYDIVNGDVGILYKKVDTDYTDFVDQEGYINFKTNHRKDKVLCRYTPISNEFIKTIDNKITSVTLILDKQIDNEIVLSISI